MNDESFMKPREVTVEQVNWVPLRPGLLRVTLHPRCEGGKSHSFLLTPQDADALDMALQMAKRMLP